MGKNTDQIATYNDLASIGYRVSDYVGSKAITLGNYNALFVNKSDITVNSSLENIHYIPTKLSGSVQKCLKWSDIPASSGQSYFGASNTEGVRVPVLCNISEEVSGATRASYITFYYKYRVAGSTTEYSKITGKVTWSSNISGSSQKICWVLINPTPENGVVAQHDYLEIHCGETNSSRDWDIYFMKPGTTVWDAVDYVVNTDICKYSPDPLGLGGKRYTTSLNRFLGIRFKVR